MATPEQVADLARAAQARGDARLAARLWETYEMAVKAAAGDVEGAVRIAEAVEWSDPINDPEWNR